MEYQDFSIWITLAADGGYQVRAETLEEGGAGGPIVRQTATAPLELPEDLQGDRVGGLLGGLARGVRDISVGAPDSPAGSSSTVAPAVDVLDIGSRLFEAVFNGDVRRLYDRSLNRTLSDRDLGLRIRLNLDPRDDLQRGLSRLPWELLNGDRARSDKGFLNLSVETPVVRDLAVSQPRAPLPFEPPLRILVVIANPPGSVPLDLDRERALIEEALAELRGAGAVELDFLEDATAEGLLDKLEERGNEFHVVHYMGHGDFSDDDGHGVLLIEGEGGEERPLSSGTLALMLQDHVETVRLVFLNACKTAASTDERVLDPYGGVAASLIETGIAAVVAMQFPISDAAATLFSKKFYQRIADGKPVDTAISMARRHLKIGMPPANQEWATPVLFMRCTDGILFQTEQARRETKPEPEEEPQGEEAQSAIPPGVDLNADIAVWLSEEHGNLALHWRSRAPGSRDFVALFRNQPTDPDGYVADAYEYASREGSYRTGEPTGPGYWVAYIAEDESGKTIKASWGPTP